MRSEPLDDLPGTQGFFVRVGAHKIEIELVGVHLGQELAAVAKTIATARVTAEIDVYDEDSLRAGMCVKGCKKTSLRLVI